MVQFAFVWRLTPSVVRDYLIHRYDQAGSRCNDPGNFVTKSDTFPVAKLLVYATAKA
jgi:hypothetical protein